MVTLGRKRNMVSVACEVIEQHVPVKLLNKKVLTRSCRFKDLVSKTLKMQLLARFICTVWEEIVQKSGSPTEPEDDF
jgi:hypothetical protein